MSIGEKIADFCIRNDYEDVPVRVRELVKIVLADMVGICCDGAIDASSKVLGDYVRECGGTGKAAALFRGFAASAPDAAMINAHQAHVDDYDDTGLCGHCSSIIGGTVLAVGDMTGASGQDIIRAYALGMEVEYRIGKVLMAPLMKYGWCSTPVFGAFGAVAAAAVLLDLDRNAIANAVGIVCSKASGVTANFGSASKPYQVGLAARSGVESAMLAKAGLTAKTDAIEGTGGFAQAYAHYELKEDEMDFGDGEWLLSQFGTVLKLYPCCLASHGAVNGLFDLQGKEGFTADDVVSVLAGVPGYANRALAFPDPQDVTESRFSMNYALANVLVHRHLGLDSFTMEMLHEPKLQEVMKKISKEHAEEYKDIYADETAPAILTVTLKDGRTLRHTARLPRIGLSEEDFPDIWEKVRMKYMNCVSGKLETEKAEKVFADIQALENVADIRSVTALLQ